MKRQRIRVWLGGAVVGLLGVGLCWRLFGQVPDPALTITLTSSNYLLLTITNGVSTANYEVYQRRLLDSFNDWERQIVGAQGQTNFTIDMGIELSGFFKATEGLDWDLDGVDNWKDGDPTDTNVAILTITIEEPANGANLD